MNLMYTVVIKKADTSIFVRNVLAKDASGKTAAQRAEEAALAAAGDGIVQTLNLQNIDIDLTV